MLPLLFAQVAAAAPARHTATAGAVATVLHVAARCMAAVASTWHAYRAALSPPAAAAAPWSAAAAAAAPVLALGACLPPPIAASAHARALSAAAAAACSPAVGRTSFSPHCFVHSGTLAGSLAGEGNTPPGASSPSIRLAESILAYVADITVQPVDSAVPATAWPAVTRGEAAWLALVLACTLEAGVADAWACGESYACAGSAAQSVLSEHAVIGGLLWGAAGGGKLQAAASALVGSAAGAAAGALVKGSPQAFITRSCCESAVSHIGLVALFDAPLGPAHALAAWRSALCSFDALLLAGVRPASMASGSQTALATLALAAAGPNAPLTPSIYVPAAVCVGGFRPGAGGAAVRGMAAGWHGMLGHPHVSKLAAKAAWMQPAAAATAGSSGSGASTPPASKIGPHSPPSSNGRPPPSTVFAQASRGGRTPAALQGGGMTGKALEPIALRLRSTAIAAALCDSAASPAGRGNGAATAAAAAGMDTGPLSRPKPPRAKTAAAQHSDAASSVPLSSHGANTAAPDAVSPTDLSAAAMLAVRELLLALGGTGQAYDREPRASVAPDSGMHSSTMPAVSGFLSAAGLCGREAHHAHSQLALPSDRGAPSLGVITVRPHESDPTHVFSPGARTWYELLFRFATQCSASTSHALPSPSQASVGQHRAALAELEGVQGGTKSPLTIASNCIEGTRGIGPFLRESAPASKAAGAKGSSGLLGRLAGTPSGTFRRSAGSESAAAVTAAAVEAASAALEAAATARRAHSLARALMHSERHCRSCNATHALLCPAAGCSGAELECPLAGAWLVSLPSDCCPAVIPGYAAPLALQCGADVRLPPGTDPGAERALTWGLHAPSPLCLRAALLGELPAADYNALQRGLNTHVPALEGVLGGALAGHTDEDVPLVLAHLGSGEGLGHAQDASQLFMTHLLGTMLACAQVAAGSDEACARRMKVTVSALRSSGVVALLQDSTAPPPAAQDDVMWLIGAAMGVAGLGAAARDQLSTAEAEGEMPPEEEMTRLQARAQLGAHCMAAVLWCVRPLLRLVWHGLCAQSSHVQWARYRAGDLSSDTLDMRPAELLSEEQNTGNALSWPLLAAADAVGLPLSSVGGEMGGLVAQARGPSISEGLTHAAQKRSSKAAKMMGSEAQAVLDAKTASSRGGSAERQGGGAKAAAMLGMLDVPVLPEEENPGSMTGGGSPNTSPGGKGGTRVKRMSLLGRFSFGGGRSAGDGAPRRRLSIAALLGAGGPLSPARQIVSSSSSQTAERRRQSRSTAAKASSKAAALLGVPAASGRAARVRAASQIKEDTGVQSKVLDQLTEDGPSSVGLLVLPPFTPLEGVCDPDPDSELPPGRGADEEGARSTGRVSKPPLLPLPIAQALLDMLTQVLPLASAAELGLSSKARASPVPGFDTGRRQLASTPACMTHVWDVAPLRGGQGGVKGGPKPPPGGAAATRGSLGVCAALGRALLLFSPHALRRCLRTVQLWRGEVASLLHCSLHARGVWGALDGRLGEAMLGKAGELCGPQGCIGTAGVRMPLPPGSSPGPAVNPPPAPPAYASSADDSSDEDIQPPDSDDEVEVPEDANATAKYALGTASVPCSALFLARSAENTSVPTPVRELLGALAVHCDGGTTEAPEGTDLQLLNVPVTRATADALLAEACPSPLLRQFILWRWETAMAPGELVAPLGGDMPGQGGVIAPLHLTRWAVACAGQGQSPLAAVAQLVRHAVSHTWGKGSRGVAPVPPPSPLTAGPAAQHLCRLDSLLRSDGLQAAESEHNFLAEQLMVRSGKPSRTAQLEGLPSVPGSFPAQPQWLQAVCSPPVAALGDAAKVFLEHTCTSLAGTPVLLQGSLMPWTVKHPPHSAPSGGGAAPCTAGGRTSPKHKPPPSLPKGTAPVTVLTRSSPVPGSPPASDAPVWPMACAAPPLLPPGHTALDEVSAERAQLEGAAAMDLLGPAAWAAHVVTVPLPSMPLAPLGGGACVTGVPLGTERLTPLLSALRALQGQQAGMQVGGDAPVCIVGVASVGGCAPHDKVHRVHGGGARRGGPSSPARPKFNPTATAARLVPYAPSIVQLQGAGVHMFVTRGGPQMGSAPPKGPPGAALATNAGAASPGVKGVQQGGGSLWLHLEDTGVPRLSTEQPSGVFVSAVKQLTPLPSDEPSPAEIVENQGALLPHIGAALLTSMGGGVEGHPALSFPTGGASPTDEGGAVEAMLVRQNTLLLSPQVWEGGNMHVASSLLGVSEGPLTAADAPPSRPAQTLHVQLSASGVGACQAWLLSKLACVIQQAQLLSMKGGAGGVITPDVLQLASTSAFQ